MNDLKFNPWRLLKEARESWDYFISDEIVYAAEIRDGQPLKRREGYLDSYISGRLWFEVVARRVKGNPQRFMWLVESCPYGLPSCIESDVHLGTNEGNDAMFVFITQLPEDAEKFQFIPLRSIVWLKIIDSAKDRVGNKIPVTLGYSPKKGVIRRTCVSAVFNGELDGPCPLWSRSGSCVRDMLLDKRPSDVIKGGPQVAQDIANKQFPVRSNSRINSKFISRGCFNSVVVDTIRKIQISLSTEGDLLIARGNTDTSIEITDVHIRPTNFAFGAIKWMHMLYTTRE
jgi:hypothetical protein